MTRTLGPSLTEAGGFICGCNRHPGLPRRLNSQGALAEIFTAHHGWHDPRIVHAPRRGVRAKPSDTWTGRP